ncbi:unnamed protein product [Symbiodinium sp. CCMP2592]|nr:unnamed protein product [Symbiodinium sp. CCMP2592]
MSGKRPPSFVSSDLSKAAATLAALKKSTAAPATPSKTSPSSEAPTPLTGKSSKGPNSAKKAAPTIDERDTFQSQGSTETVDAGTGSTDTSINKTLAYEDDLDNDDGWWGSSTDWMPRSWSSCSWDYDWGYGPQKQWWKPYNRGMSKDLSPYEGWSWGRGASDSSLQTQTDSQTQEDLRLEVEAALKRSPTSDMDQQRPTAVVLTGPLVMQQPTVEPSKVEPQASVMQQPTVEPSKVESQAPVMQQPTVEPSKVEPQASVMQQPSKVESQAPVMQQPTVEPSKVESQADAAPVMQQPTVEPSKVDPPVMQQPVVEPCKVESQATLGVDAAALSTPREKPPVPKFAPDVYKGPSSVEQYLDQAYGDSHRSPDRSRFYAEPQDPALSKRESAPMQVDVATPIKQQNPGAKLEEQATPAPMEVDTATPVKQQENPGAKLEEQATSAPKQVDTSTPVKQQNPGVKLEERAAPAPKQVDTSTPVKQQSDAAVKSETKASPGKGYNKADDPDSWRKNRRGQWLSPHALYMRFYRSTRGQDVDPDVAKKRIDAEGSPSNACLSDREKMHQLYLHYLTTNSTESEDTYEWWTMATMIRELGPELAADLKQRHETSDPRRTGRFIKEHPDFPGEQFRYKNFSSSKEMRRKVESSEAQIEMTADVEQDDAFEAMEKLLAEQDNVGAGQGQNPKPPKPIPKPKKEKTWAQLARADQKANLELTEYEGFLKSENFRDALMKDLAPFHLMLSSSKHDVASAMGNKVDEALQKSITDFKFHAQPIRDAIKKANPKPKSNSKPKGKAKARNA